MSIQLLPRISSMEQLAAEVERAERDFQRRCGLVYEVYAQNVQTFYESVLQDTAPEIREQAKDFLISRGFIENYEEPEIEEGTCPRTGMDSWFCPCGQH